MKNKKKYTEENSQQSFEIARNRVFRHHYTANQKIYYFIKEYLYIVMVMVCIAPIFNSLLLLPCFATLIFMFLICLSFKNQMRWLQNESIYQNFKTNKNKGLIYFGKDKDSGGKSLWFNNNELRAHILLFGTTGAGKTEYILNLIFQYIVLGSGFIYVDGKASVNTWLELYSMARKVGLEDNLLVINFFTGNKSLSDKTVKISNTHNPFSYGSSDTLMEVISGMMSKSSGENAMWRDRAEALGRCLLKALCELRDKGKLELSIDTIRENMPLEKIEALSRSNELSEDSREDLIKYLNDLPGWKIFKKSSNDDQMSDAQLEANKQHNYLTMQFTHMLGLLSSTYGHITKTDLSEIDFMDVIKNKRFLYIMLPSLEKSSTSQKQLGRIIVTSLRNALSRLLDADKLSGSELELYSLKQYKRDIPFPIFLDEYGTYCVEGFADIAAQARELGISLCFSGQDYPSFKNSSESEAQRVVSNTSIKIFMKTECSVTKQIAVERGSKAYAYMSNQIERSTRQLQGFKDSGVGNLQHIDRILFDDLLKQQPGESHILFGDQLWRVKSFKCDIKKASYFKLNTFLKLRTNSTVDGATQTIKNWMEETRSFVHPDNMPKELKSVLNKNKEKT